MWVIRRLSGRPVPFHSQGEHMKASRFLAVMLFVAGAVVVVDAQQPRQPGGGFQFRLDPATLVISNKALQEELKVTDAQLAKFKDVVEKQKKANESAFKGGGFKKGEFDKEKFAERQKEREALTAEIKKVTEETLTADQKKRIKQIDRQILGMRAFTNEEVATELKLSDEQKSKIKGIVDEYTKDTAALGGRGGFNKGGFDKEKAAENQAKREKLRKAATADIEEVLTADQRKQWKDMTGEPFDTTKLFQFGGGRGPRGNNTKTKD